MLGQGEGKQPGKNINTVYFHLYKLHLQSATNSIVTESTSTDKVMDWRRTLE